jgi:hypothetical protein
LAASSGCFHGLRLLVRLASVFQNSTYFEIDIYGDQIGDILQTVASHPSPTPQTVSSVLASPAIITKLVLLSFLSLAPILGREHLRALITHEQPPQADSTEEKRSSRWSVAWVQDWRTKIRMSSRSRTRSREASEHELSMLVDEKRAIEDLAS